MEELYEARQIIYHGNVQGVGFRRKCCQIALNYQVGGTVKNLSDGTVLLQVQGAKKEIERFLAEILRAFDSKISGQKCSDLGSLKYPDDKLRIVD
jgi:acylphosphatase